MPPSGGDGGDGGHGGHGGDGGGVMVSNEMMNLWKNHRMTMINFAVSLRLIALSTRAALYG